MNNNQQLIINNLIQTEVDRIATKYGKDFLDCEDIMKITGLGRNNVRSLLRSKDFPTTKVVFCQLSHISMCDFLFVYGVFRRFQKRAL